jgi:hypothetical protein
VRAAGAGGTLYSAKEIDYYAIYVLPVEVWYIFPIKTLQGMEGVALRPQSASSKYSRYKENWFLLTRHHFRRGTRTIIPDQDNRPASMNQLTARILKRLKGETGVGE